MSGLKINTPIRFVILFLFMIAGLIWAQSCNQVIEKYFSGRILFLAESVIQNLLVFFLPAYFTFKIGHDNPLKTLGTYKWYNGKSFLCSLMIFLVALPFMETLIEWNEHIKLPDSLSSVQNSIIEMENQARAITEQILKIGSFSGLIGNILIVAVLTGFCEEIFFRGAIQGLFVRMGWNGHVAVWVSAVIFSVMHFQFLGFFPRILTGVFFGYLFLWNRSIWLNSSMHAINNMLVVISYWLLARGVNIDPDNLFGLNGSAAYISALISAVVTVLVMVWSKKYITTDNG